MTVKPRDITLTPRQQAVCALMLEDRSAKQIARELKISYRTVETYKKQLYTKMGVQTRLQLVRKILEDRIAELTATRSLPA